MKLKKLAAITLAGAMVFSTTAISFAAGTGAVGDPATGNATGEGGVEGIVKTDIYTVDVPTMTTNSYDYIADPQGLINETLDGEEGAARSEYEGKTFEEGATVFFQNKDGNYSSTSDADKIVNKSSMNLDVTVTAKATADGSGAGLATAKTFESSNTEEQVYLGITSSLDEDEDALTAAGVELTAVLGAAPEGVYVTEYDATLNSNQGGYTYAIKDDVSAYKFAEMSYQINGAANPYGADWATDTVLPEIEVTWSLELTEDEATVETPAQTPADPYADAEEITLTAGSTTLYKAYSELGFTASDITKIQVKVDDAELVDVSNAGNDATFKVAIDSSWASATSVKVYIATADKSYVCVYK